MLVDAATREYRADAADLEARAFRELSRAWARMDLSNVDEVREASIEVAAALDLTYGDAIALLSAEYYEELRSVEGAPGQFIAAPVVTLDEEQLRKDIGWAVDPLTRGDAITAYEKVATVTGTLLTLAGTGTVRENAALDPQSQGWYRIARANGCDFCVMLSQRGAVYKENTADFAAHGNCNCSAKPAFDPDAPEVEAGAYVASERTAAMRARDAADGGNRYGRHKEYVKSWMKSNQDSLDSFRSELI